MDVGWYLRIITLMALLYAAPYAAQAQNVSGVPGPIIKEGEKSVQLRLGFDPDSDELVQRLHYQQSLDDKVRLRLQLQTRSRPDETIEADFVQGQIWVQLSPDDAQASKRLWQSGVRLDLRVEADGPPGRAALNWVNQFRLSDDMSARFFLQGAVQIGNGAVDGIILQSRSHLHYRLDGGGFGIEQFNGFGATGNLPAFADQSHQIGPYGNVALGGGWSLFGSALLGITRGTDDMNIRLFIGKSF